MSFDQTQFQQNLNKAIEHASKEMAQLRTGKASLQMLDPVVVEAYASQMRINELANVSAPDPNLLVVTPWDKSILSAIEKAIGSSNLNLNPVVDGDKIRIVIPALTEERRKEMVKMLYQKIESTKIMLRNVRVDAKKVIEEQKGGAGISEDDIERDIEKMDKIFKKAVDELAVLAEKKEKELMSV